ncbi:penicillin-binding protein 1C [Allochromatium vinosum]|uniref:peptidoglycan glycosyltransferase n=1 Tax=Allochromatium vinosum (strain ATCC 17899 / DSM 180 / NBRC 103801 / NCIMB 10441 / D) TaxID=572477 RepID=D3RPG8_ALLVD|nr:penicillin-binding protein 1C [Allochromatium vinosum]ADC61550.1 penicillin-binding protein 1C [Allochromatium vinosum DSM 180]
MMRRYRIGLLLAVGLVIGAGAGVWLWFDDWIDTAPLPEIALATSPQILDREGRLLRAFPVADGRWRLPVALDAVDPRYLDRLLAIEDRRFRDHAGVDPLALMRAAWQWLRYGRIVSGGSTITMQLARLLDGRSTRDLAGKLHQMRLALALERQLDKDAILSAYLNLTPQGGNLEGVRAGALAWFGHEPHRLTATESALLIALPQAPEARRPDRDPETLRRACAAILQRLHAAGLIDTIELAGALREPVPSARRPFPMLAAHLAWRAHRAHPERSIQRLTLDARLQERLETLAAERARALGERVSLAILVADHTTGEIHAAVGSPDPLDEARRGHVDMTRAIRSPGSTLKPLIYGLAFEDGIAHPESLIEDRPTGFDGYAPTNFDRAFQGTVSVRHALQASLNIPAVRLLEAVGPARLTARLRRAGVEPVLPDGSAPGLAIGLGGVGVTLTDLVRLYAAIARGGSPVVLRVSLERETTDDDPIRRHGSRIARPSRPVLDERAAWLVGSILAGVPAPDRATAERIAFKTGTSYGYRDAWAIGFDGRWVVGVWTGRADGAPVPGLAGIEAAAPILIDVFAQLGRRAPLPPPPPGVRPMTHAQLPEILRHVPAASRASASVTALEIAYPPPGARIDLGFGSARTESLVLRVRGGTPPFTWFADSGPIAREPFSRAARWIPTGPGYVTLVVVDGRGESARVRVRLD